MHFSRRDWMTAALAGVPAALVAAGPTALSAQEAVEPPAPGALTDDTLGSVIEALIKTKPKKIESRYDFAFAIKVEEEWNFSMSAVLSADKKTVWIMAWLDELPRSARDVPRTALLKLLAANDKMGKGRFFSYIPTSRRFALQQVVGNHDMTPAKFKVILVELGKTVALTYPQWSTAAWKEPASPDTDDDGGDDDSAITGTPATGTPASGSPAASGGAGKGLPPTRTATPPAAPGAPRRQ